jgi:hypothetical protein
MEQQGEIKKQRRPRTKLKPEEREEHRKKYWAEYYQENFKPYTNEHRGRPKKELTPEELEEKKRKAAEYKKQHYQKIKQLKELSEKKD